MSLASCASTSDSSDNAAETTENAASTTEAATEESDELVVTGAVSGKAENGVYVYVQTLVDRTGINVNDYDKIMDFNVGDMIRVTVSGDKVQEGGWTTEPTLSIVNIKLVELMDENDEDAYNYFEFKAELTDAGYISASDCYGYTGVTSDETILAYSYPDKESVSLTFNSDEAYEVDEDLKAGDKVKVTLWTEGTSILDDEIQHVRSIEKID